VFAEDFGGLAGAAKVRAKNGVDGVKGADLLGGFGGLGQAFGIERDIEPAAQPFIATGHIQAGVAMANNQ
jgi:hypothetical protein